MVRSAIWRLVVPSTEYQCMKYNTKILTITLTLKTNPNDIPNSNPNQPSNPILYMPFS